MTNHLPIIRSLLPRCGLGALPWTDPAAGQRYVHQDLHTKPSTETGIFSVSSAGYNWRDAVRGTYCEVVATYLCAFSPFL